MNKYLEELKDDLSDVRQRLEYAESSYDDVENSFEEMDIKLDDIKDIIEDESTAEEKVTRIKEILTRKNDNK